MHDQGSSVVKEALAAAKSGKEIIEMIEKKKVETEKKKAEEEKVAAEKKKRADQRKRQAAKEERER